MEKVTKACMRRAESVQFRKEDYSVATADLSNVKSGMRIRTCLRALRRKLLG